MTCQIKIEIRGHSLDYAVYRAIQTAKETKSSVYLDFCPEPLAGGQHYCKAFAPGSKFNAIYHDMLAIIEKGGE